MCLVQVHDLKFHPDSEDSKKFERHFILSLYRTMYLICRAQQGSLSLMTPGGLDLLFDSLALHGWFHNLKSLFDYSVFRLKLNIAHRTAALYVIKIKQLTNSVSII